jgi:hypothetical protein
MIGMACNNPSIAQRGQLATVDDTNETIHQTNNNMQKTEEKLQSSCLIVSVYCMHQLMGLGLKFAGQADS